MKKYYAPPILTFLLTGVVFYLLYFHYSIFTQESLMDVYSNKLQVPLFTGFLTISGFLLSLTTFIIVKMHEAVYQDNYYNESRVETFKRIDPDYSGTRPLKDLSIFLLGSVVVTLAASFSQFTIGNYPNPFFSIFCISLATMAAICVLTSCWLIKKNITAWIDFMEEKNEKAIK